MNAAVAQLINEQINKEFYSAYLYLDFANYYAAAGLDGFENWYRVQAQEERDHALLFSSTCSITVSPSASAPSTRRTGRAATT